MAEAITDAAAKLGLGEAPADNAPKLMLDEETGEMVSKGELKKRLAKRAKKALKDKNKEEKGKGTPADLATAQAGAASKKPKAKEEDLPLDPDAMFKQGFLSEVFKERPIKPVVTRFPPEPNGFLHIGKSGRKILHQSWADHNLDAQDTVKRSQSTLASPSTMEEHAISVSTIRIPRQRRRFTSRPSRIWFGGWATSQIGSRTPPIISSSSTTKRKSSSVSARPMSATAVTRISRPSVEGEMGPRRDSGAHTLTRAQRRT